MYLETHFVFIVCKFNSLFLFILCQFQSQNQQYTVKFMKKIALKNTHWNLVSEVD